MNSIITSAEPTELLNKKVAAKIAKHLFLFCNYTPESIVAFSDDAKFLKGILNLYKAMYDVGIFDRKDGLVRRYLNSQDSARIGMIMQLIHSMRTLIAHNENYYNVGEENKECAERWFVEVIGKKQPEFLEEYVKPLCEITNYGNEYVKIVDKFVDEVSKKANKENIIKEWEKQIFKFYKKSNSKNIFKGNLKEAYQAHKGSAHESSIYEIAMWVQKMYLFDEQSKIKALSDLPKGRRLSTKVLKEIEKKIKDNEEKLYNKKCTIAKNNNKEVDDLKPFDYLNYYIAMLPQRIVDEFENDSCGSLLPQDIVQVIIEKDFSEIPAS